MGRFSNRSLKVPPGIRNAGAYKNLMTQVNKIGDHIRQGSFGTRERYHDAVDRFARHLADQYNLQKFANISDKHLSSYIQFMREKGLSPSTIKTELSAIRMYHDAAPFAKHKLSPNDSFDLERRKFGGIDRSWSQSEYQGMKEMAKVLERNEIADIITLGREVGLRIHECTRLDYATAQRALSTGELHVKGKGGLVRDVPLRPAALATLRDAIGRVGPGQKLFVPVGMKTHQVIGAVKDFVYNHRDKFAEENRESNMTFHGLRHSFASEEYNSRITRGGLDEVEARREVSELLGHGRDDVTRIYLN